MGSDARRTPRPVRPLAAVVAVASLLAGLLSGCTTDAGADTGPPELVVNGTFEAGTDGWRTNDDLTQLSIGPGRDGGSAAVLTSKPGTIAVLNDKDPTVRDTSAGDTYRVSAWVRTNQPTLKGAIRIREVHKGWVRPTTKTFDLTGPDWEAVEFPVTAQADGSQFDLNILGNDLVSGQQLMIADVSMKSTGTQPVTRPSAGSPAQQWRLSNGVLLSERGIPADGALFGAAVGGNADPAAFEAAVGQRLGIRRTYWGGEQVEVAVETARTDLAAGRLPWMSFKLPYEWDEMAAGDGDEWVSDLAEKLGELPGPVWIAFHHEPEGDGPIEEWKAMQERLAPIVRETAPNVAYTVILTGWNQLKGAEKFDLDKIWPNTTIDLAGFDIYNMYGTEKDGKVRQDHTNLARSYFDPIARWAATKKVAWGLAESGLNDAAAADNPKWLMRSYRQLVAAGGSAYTYFNSPLNSSSSWVITSPAKTQMFARVLQTTPTFPKLT